MALEDSEIRGHRMIGVIVRSGGAATLRRCVITANRAFGIDVAAMGTATIENCDLKGNRVGAIKTWRGSKVQKSGNRE